MNNFRISLESPQCGWMAVGLLQGDEVTARCAAWHAPFTPLEDLIEGVAALADGSRSEAVVRWNCEPEQYDWHFRAAGPHTQIRVLRYADARRLDPQEIFAQQLPTAQLAQQLLAEVRELRNRAERDVFVSNWQRPFPDAALERLSRIMNDKL